MADGGWVYDTYAWLPQSLTDADYEGVVDDVIAVLAGFTDWSTKTARTKIIDGADGRDAYFFEMEHTGGAILAFVWAAGCNAATKMIDASNNYLGFNINANSADHCIYVAYFPPGATPGAATPDLAGYIPSDAFLFELFQADTTSYDLSSVVSGGSHRFHFFVRGDDVIIGFERDSHSATTIDALHILGTGIDQLAHATDTSGEIQMAWKTNSNGIDPYVQGDAIIQFFLQDGTRVTDSDGTRYYFPGCDSAADTTLSLLVCDRDPWNWVQPAVMIANADLDNYGVVAGNGIKGTIDPEVYRIIQPAVVSPKALLSSGNYVHLGDGAVVGFDSGNPAMS